MPMIEVFSNGKPTGKAVEVPAGYHLIDKKAPKGAATEEARRIADAMGVKS